jgi:hypothetical protein
MKRTVALLKLLMEGEAARAMAPNKGSSKLGELVPRRNGKGHIIYYTISYTYILYIIYIIYILYILYILYIYYIPVVPHKAVAEVSKIGNL